MEHKELFFSLLGSELVKEGFEYKKSINGFIKKENGNEYKYTFELWPQFIQVDAAYDIVLKEVEDVKKKYLEKEYRKRFSLGSYKRDILTDKTTKTTHWTDTEEAVKKLYIKK